MNNLSCLKRDIVLDEWKLPWGNKNKMKFSYDSDQLDRCVQYVLEKKKKHSLVTENKFYTYEYIKEKIFDYKYFQIFNELFELRQESDYGLDEEFKKEDVAGYIEKAKGFLEEAKKYLGEK